MPKPITPAQVRVRVIRSRLAARGMTVSDLAKAYSRGGRRVHESMVYRVIHGQRRSERIERYIARAIGASHKELWQ